MTEQMTLQRVSAENLHEKLQTGKPPVLINALSKEDYTDKRIAGSVNVPTKNAEWIENIVPDKDQEIIVYCANADCPASNKLADKLLEKGYSQVWDFEEGLQGWEDADYEFVGQNVK